MNSDNAGTQTQADVEQAKRRADYADALKREADARKAAAEADAAAANVAATSRAAAAKAETDADKGRLDYLKGALPAVPDPSKYKIAAPTAPNVAGAAARLAYADTTVLAEKVAAGIKADLRIVLDNLAKTPKYISLVPEDAKTRTLIALSRALREVLDLATERIGNEHKDLDAKIEQQLTANRLSFSPPFLPALSAIGELLVSYATILRAQYGFATISQVTPADVVLKSKVQRALLNSNINILEPDAVVPIQWLTGPTPPELTKLKSLQDALADLRKKIREVNGNAMDRRASAPKPKDDKDKETADNRAAILKFADEIDARAKQASGVADDVDKILATLYVADAQGNTPLDSALRGGLLNDRLTSSSAAFMLGVKVVSSDVDTIAADGLFKGLRVWVSSNTVVSWRLTSLDGLVTSVGAEGTSSPMEKLPLPE